jgi:hypothetical protein
MRKKKSNWLGSLAPLIALTVASAFGTAAQQKRPNTLVILVDNLGYGEPGMYTPPQKLPLPKVINLWTDRKEERDVAAYNSWVADPVVRIIGELEVSFKKYPPIKTWHPGPIHATRDAGFAVARMAWVWLSRATEERISIRCS